MVKIRQPKLSWFLTKISIFLKTSTNKMQAPNNF